MSENNFFSKLKYINLNSDFQEVLRFVNLYKNFSFDFETAGLNDLSPILVSFVIKGSDGYYGFVVDMREHNDIDIFFNIFEKTDLVICHNLSFDLRVLYLMGFDIYKIGFKVYDTMLALYALNTEQKKGLKNFIEKYESVVKYEDAFDILNFNLEESKNYNLKDAYYTYLLYEESFKEIQKKNSYLSLYLEIQISILSIYMMETGIYVDFDYLNTLINDEYKQKLKSLEDDLKLIAKNKYKFDLDLNSRNNIVEFFSRYLLKGLKLDTNFQTEKGNISITSDNIEYLIENNDDIDEDVIDFLKKYIEYKELRKIVESYSSENLSVNELYSRVYPQINSSGTRTSRMTVTNPPLQTIPMTELGKQIRRAFCSKDENNFLVIDLSQLELRILVYYINRDNLITKYNQGIDLHTQTSELLGVSRKEAKIINFMIIYGGGSSSLSRKLNITKEKATEYISNFINKLDGYKDLKTTISRFCINNKYIRLPLNYYRYLNGDNNYVERVGFNSLIQSTASIYVKLGMYLLFHVFKNNSGMLLQIHDELLFENSEKMLNIIFRFLKRVYERMFIYTNEGTIGQDLDFKIEGKIGSNWLDCK